MTQGNSTITAPDFICIGAQRSGTTWLYKQLNDHPRVWLPPIKEFHYFDRTDPVYAKQHQREAKYHAFKPYLILSMILILKKKYKLQNIDYIITEVLWLCKFLFGSKNDEWYKELFLIYKRKGFISGDITPAYAVISEKSVQRIRKLNPEIKILYVMRHPIRRTWSHVKKDLAREKNRKVSDLTLEEIKNFIRTTDCYMRSDYKYTIKLYESIFPRKNIKYLFFQELIQNPKNFLDRITDFLGITRFKEIKSLGRVNSTEKKSVIPREIYTEIHKIHQSQIKFLKKKFSNRYVQNW